METRVLATPGRFIVGKGELDKLGEYAGQFGKSALLIAFHEDSARVSASLDKLEKSGISLTKADFEGECTKAEIGRLNDVCASKNADVVIGLGGGKAIDTAKCVAVDNNKPMIVVPTIASTDAPCSTLCVIYTEDHVFDDCYFFPRNPDIVLADSQVIANAPVRFLAAGIGDAYATYFEARACIRSGARNHVGGVSTEAAYALAELSHKLLLRDGAKAIAACKQKTVTRALENIIETNLLLSGLGFESVGLAAAHSIHDAITILPDVRDAIHGEKVAIGVLAQHVLENETDEQIAQTIRFFRKVGLPTKLSGIGLKEDASEKLKRVAEITVTPGNAIHNLPFKVTADMVHAALMNVDSLESVI